MNYWDVFSSYWEENYPLNLEKFKGTLLRKLDIYTSPKTRQTHTAPLYISGYHLWFILLHSFFKLKVTKTRLKKKMKINNS